MKAWKIIISIWWEVAAMRNLLAANFGRLKKDNCFWLCVLVMFVLGILQPVLKYINIKKGGFSSSTDDILFMYTLWAGIVLSVFCSLFIGTEYSDGTIRNKIIVGHTRTAVYLSNLVVCMTAGVFICLSGVAASLLVGIPLLGYFQSDIRILLLLLLCSFVMSFAYAGIFTLIAMLNQNKAIVAVFCILGAFILLFAASYINSRLQEPEFINTYTYTLSDKEDGSGIKTDDPTPNPLYLSGTKREMYEFLYDLLPSGQAIQLYMRSPAHLWQMYLYSLGILAATTGCGLICFRKKDLK